MIIPVLASRDIPSGNGGKLELVLMEYVYGGEPPLATIVQPVYALPCVPLGHDVVSIVSVPPDAVTVTCAVAVAEPALLLAVRV
jgi:hypothetical protein